MYIDDKMQQNKQLKELDHGISDESERNETKRCPTNYHVRVWNRQGDEENKNNYKPPR